MTELELRIKEASQAYYENGSSRISDSEFDKLVNQLKIENPNSELLKGHSFGYDVNSDSTPGAKVKHKYGTIGSLDKAYNWKEMKLNGTATVDVSAKLDGMSIVLYYSNGYMYRALTRGVDNIGIDVTDKVKLIVPVSIADNGFTGAVRGEIIMTDASFEEFKKLNPEAKNPRNCTVGLINSKSFDYETGLKFLDVVVYSIVGQEGEYLTYETDISGIRLWLNANFQDIAPYTQLSLSEDNYMEELTSLRDKWAKIYPIDGLVITTDVIYSGYELKYNAFAFKFKATAKTSMVQCVEWEMSKQGYAVPTVIIQPTTVDGSTINRCTGYNAKYIVDNEIGPGTVVEFEKRGEIIPNINKVVDNDGMQFIDIIKECPYCGIDLQWDSVNLICSNKQCPNIKKWDLLIWLENLAPIDNLGDTLKLKFFQERFSYIPDVDEVMVSSNFITDAYRQKGKQWSTFVDMWNKLFNNSVELVAAIKALNIPRFGDVTAEKLSKFPEQIQWLIAYNEKGRLDVGCEIGLRSELEPIGKANVDSLISNWRKFNRLKYIKDRIVWEKKVPHEFDIRGMVAITGKLSVPRAQLEKELNQAGWVVEDMKKTTNYLITDDPNSGSSKNIKADNWGVTKITEQEFRNRYM